VSHYKTPCQQGDPENWFIEDDGKQYPDDHFLSEELEEDLFLEARANGDDRSAAEIIGDFDVEAKADALKRRRHAIDACHIDCRLRLQCLDLGLQPDTLSYGIYGGYTAKQRREIVKVRDEKRSRRG
jgi:hypothetical protein